MHTNPQDTPDVQKRNHNYVPGFGSLADFIASDSDHATAIYKRFDRLAARDLLHYQSELASLQALQDQYDIQDAKDVVDSQQPDLWYDIRRHAQDWDVFNKPSGAAPLNGTATSDARVDNGRWLKRHELAMRIRRTLKDYRDALIQESTLLGLRQPTEQAFEAFSNSYHTRSKTAAGIRSQEYYPLLKGASAQLYPRGLDAAQIHASDYVSLSAEEEPDLLTYLLKTYCSRLFRTQHLPVLPQYKESISYLPRHQVTRFSLRRVRFAASFITTLTAALLLFLPIYTLYRTAPSWPKLTLGLIALFTLAFAGAIVTMTRARRAEIFGACAAYAAVLVVFVSGDFIGGS